MKILMINSVCGIRSTGRMCTDLAEELEKQGHDVRIAYGREAYVPKQFHKYAIRIGNDYSVRLHALYARLFDASGFGSKKETIEFIEWIEKYDPDIIHLHNIHGYYINIEILFNYLKGCNKKIVWTLHDCWAFTGHSGTCEAKDCTRWKTGCYDCPMTKEYPKSFVDRSKHNWTIKRNIFTAVPRITIITPSHWLERQVIESFLSKYEVQTIYNGIDLNQFSYSKSNFKEHYKIQDKFMVLGVASVWNKDKGLNDFIELSRVLDDQYKIVLVGLNERQLKTIPKKIIGIKKTNNINQLVEIYSAADVFVNPTYCDTYPTVNLEAQACGTPVITYNTGGSPESVLSNGSIVEKGNLNRLTKKIIEYCSKSVKSSGQEVKNKAHVIKEYLMLFNTISENNSKNDHFEKLM